MKQHITGKQIKELTPEQQERLRNWWEPEPGDWFQDKDSETRVNIETMYDGSLIDDYGIYAKKDSVLLLSIGQCIELIIDITGKLPQLIEMTGDGECTMLLQTANMTDLNQRVYLIGIKGQKRLIDAFWQVIKEVL